MLSLKNFLNASEEEIALRKVLSLLLEKIATAAAKGDSAEHAEFCIEMDRLRERAVNEISPAQLFIAAGSAMQAMEIYNLRVTGMIRRQSADLQCVVSMIVETALKLGGENTRSAQRLQEIGSKFDKAGSQEDLLALKTHLSDCLNSFREEVQRQKSESDIAIVALQREIERKPATAGAPAGENRDPITGLARKSDGLLAMQAATQSGKRLYTVAMVVKGVQSVNTRFGFEVGDRMLRVFKENIEKQLSRADRLFRWDGPSIVVLMDRPEPITQIRAQIRRILETRVEETFNVNGRSVLLPIAADWMAFPLMPPVALAVKQISAFVAGQSPVNSTS